MSAVSLILFVFPWTSLASAAEDPEVRQLVSFQLLPGKTAQVIELFEQRALPLYEQNEAMLRFRGYRESESPIPLDLMVVSSFRGMAGMDESNRKLRALAEARGSTIGAIYGGIAAHSQSHRDEFVEIDPKLRQGELGASHLTVFHYLEVAPGGTREFEELLATQVIEWEASLDWLAGSECGRFLISDGWDYLCWLAIEELGQWHDYLGARSREGWSENWDRLVTRSRPLILLEVPELSVR